MFQWERRGLEEQEEQEEDLRFGFPSIQFPYGLPTKMQRAFLVSACLGHVLSTVTSFIN
jgi:hypothetical protein